jgi:hypothetical protein
MSVISFQYTRQVRRNPMKQPFTDEDAAKLVDCAVGLAKNDCHR